MNTKPSLILFVCQANQCRSPLAEGLFKDMLFRRTGNPWKYLVESAGTWVPTTGMPVASGSRKALERRGIVLPEHASRPVDARLFNRASLVLVMEKNQKEALCAEFPHDCGRIRQLSEMSGEDVDIPDPIGGSDANYEDTARLLEELLEAGFEQILVQVEKNNQRHSAG